MKPLIEFAWGDGADQSLGLPKYATSGAAGADLRANLIDRVRFNSACRFTGFNRHWLAHCYCKRF